MVKIFKAGLIMIGLITLVTGLVYPLIITGIAQLIFPYQANGSLVSGPEGKMIGSALIGQVFDDPAYFWGRLSATDPQYNAGTSGGSNQSVMNEALAQRVRDRIAALHALDPGNTVLVPVDLVTTSGSGLDPDISPAAASYQVSRVAQARGLSEAQVRDLVEAHIEGPALGVFGERRVNVLKLNLALDQLAR